MNGVEPPRKSRPINVAGWISLVILGLFLETCLLAILAGAFLYRQGRLDLPFVANREQATQITTYPSLLPPTLTIQEQGSSNPTPIKTLEPLVETVTEMPTVTETFLVTASAWQFPPKGKIVFVCFDGEHDQICTMKPDGRQLAQLTLTNTAATNFYPSLSPDGECILFSSNRDGNFEIFSMDLTGQDVQQLTDDMGNLYAPEFAPNSNRIIFTREVGGKQNIWIMRADGGNARPLTDSGSDIDPTWSPNGELIAFTSARNGVKQLFVMNSNGNNPRPVNLVNGPKIGGRTSWSPDGKWLAFYGGPSGDRDIYLTSLDGRILNQLTDGGDNLGPSFSPDGEWLAFTSFRNGNNEIYVMQVDGSNQARLTIRNQSDWQPRWGE
jgi:TolB protein